MIKYLVFRIVKCNIFVFKWNYDATNLVQMSDGSQLMFCESPIDGEMGYVFRKRVVERKNQESWKKEPRVVEERNLDNQDLYSRVHSDERFGRFTTV